MVLFVATRGGGGPDLPSYAVTAGAEQAMRGPAERRDATLHVGRSAGSRFEIVARPETAVPDATVVAYAFAIEGDEPIALDAQTSVSKAGAVKIAGDARALANAREVRIIVATPEEIGGYDGVVARAKSGASDAHVRVLRVPIDRD